jgi:exopolysaccharide biosynthesis polyprenyl glycosylphosphotransferase
MDFIKYIVNLKVFKLLKKWNALVILIVLLDILALTLAYQISYLINYDHSANFFFSQNNILFLYLGIVPFWLLVLYLIKINEIPRTKSYYILLFEYFQSALIIGLILLTIYFIFKMAWISRLFLIEFTFLGFIFLFVIRLLEYKVFKTYRTKGYNFINIVLVADETSIPFIEGLLSNKDWGYKIMAIITSSQKVKELYEKAIILVHDEYIKVINDLMEVRIIDEVLYIKKKVVPAEVRNLVRSCEELGVVFRLNHSEKNINLTNALKTKIGDNNFLTFINIPHNSYALAIKKTIDINFSLLAIILLSPVLLAIMVLIKLSSPGPVIYQQTRVGLRGRLFQLYKFRTMIVNADELKKELETENEMDGPVFKIKNDPRVTKIGKFLRRTGLDELPQLFNILKGEMSLIGPRPPIPSETQQYKRWQLRRLSVKPGLSCFWQIKPDRNSIKFEKWMEMDLAYIDNWSLRLDFIILLKTIKTIFQRTGL